MLNLQHVCTTPGGLRQGVQSTHGGPAIGPLLSREEHDRWERYPTGYLLPVVRVTYGGPRLVHLDRLPSGGWGLTVQAGRLALMVCGRWRRDACAWTFWGTLALGRQCFAMKRWALI